MDFRPTAGGIDDESGQRKDEQKLAQFGRLEGEEWKFECLRRSARGDAESEDREERGAEERVGTHPQFAEAGIVDPGNGKHCDNSH